MTRMPTTTVLLLLRAYKLVLSPLFAGSCRFTPSCSSYAADAVREKGAAKGLWLTARRVVRCHPFGGEGYDPAPLSAEQPHAEGLGSADTRVRR